MPARFRKSESVAAGLSRIAGIHIDAAMALVTRGQGLDDDDVHEVRVVLKRLRALWRLARPHVDAARFKALNKALRDAGRALSSRRDMHVMSQTLGAMSRRARKAEARQAIEHVALRVAACVNKAYVPAEPDARIGEALDEARAQFAALKLPAGGWAALEPGMRRSYRLARRCLAAAEAKSGDAVDAPLHELRKRVKDLRYQFELTVAAAPRTLGAMVKLIRRVGRRLGRAHDAAMVRDLLADDAAGRFGDAAAVAMAIERLRKERDRLASDSIKLAHELLDEPTGAWRKTIRRAWRQWRPNERGD